MHRTRGISRLAEALSGLQGEPCCRDFVTVCEFEVFVVASRQSENAFPQVPSLETEEVEVNTVM